MHLHDKQIDLVPLNVGVPGHERQTLHCGLGDEHPIKLVPVVDRKPARRYRACQHDL
jgi:hypothetical protein